MIAVDFARKLHEEEQEKNRRKIEEGKEEAKRWKTTVEKKARHASVIDDRQRWSFRVRAATLGKCREN